MKKALAIVASFLFGFASSAWATTTYTYDGAYVNPTHIYYASPTGVDTANTCMASTNPCSLHNAVKAATSASEIGASMLAVQLAPGVYTCGFGASGPYASGGGNNSGSGFVGLIGDDQGDVILNDEGSLAGCPYQGSGAIVLANDAKLAVRSMTITSENGTDLYAYQGGDLIVDKNVVFGPACSSGATACATYGQLHSEQQGLINVTAGYTIAALTGTGTICNAGCSGAGTVLTIAASPAPTAFWGPGVCFQGAAIPSSPLTCITANGTGTGGAGTYTVNNSLSIASEAFTGFTSASHWQSVLDGMIIVNETPMTITLVGTPSYNYFAQIGSGSALYSSGGGISASFSGSATGEQCFIKSGGVFEGNPAPPTLPGNAGCEIGNGGVIHPMPHPTVDVGNPPTGLGTGGAAAIGTTSGDHSWAAQLSTGTAATAATGQIQVDWGLVETNVKCSVTLASGSASWNGQAAVQISSTSASQATLVWSNNAVALTANKTYYISGVCGNDKLYYDTYN